jgi:hypothetical protein
MRLAVVRGSLPPQHEHTPWQIIEGRTKMTPDSDPQARTGKPPLSWRRAWDGIQTLPPRHWPSLENWTTTP